MRINHNMMAANAHRSLGVNTGAQTKSLEKLSSGLQINRAADNAAGLSISEKMRSQIAGLDQSSKNAQDGVSFLQTAEGAMNEVSDMLVRVQDLVTQRANGTYSADDQANIDLELTQLTGEMTDVVSNTKFNGQSIDGTINVCVGGDTGTLTAIGVAGIAAGADFAALTAATGATMTTTMVNDAITEINTVRSTFGAQQNKLEHVVKNLDTTSENLQSAESRIRDTDMAKEMANFNKYNILVQASTSMLSQANSSQQSILSLLRG